MNWFLPAIHLCCFQLIRSCPILVPQQYPPVPAHRNVMEGDDAHKVSIFLVSNKSRNWWLAGGQKQKPGCQKRGQPRETKALLLCTDFLRSPIKCTGLGRSLCLSYYTIRVPTQLCVDYAVPLMLAEPII